MKLVSKTESFRPRPISNGMKISIKVKAGAKVEKVEKKSDGSYAVWIKAPAKEGKANEALIKIFAEYFGVPRSAVKILSGFSSPHKIVEIL